MTRIVLLVLFTMVAAAAQEAGPPSVPAQSPTAGATAKKSDQASVLASEQYTDAVANVLLSRIAEGFTRRNPKLLLSAFDPQRFEAYPLFADRMRARLGQNDSFRAYFRIVDSVLQDGRATVRVELQIEQASSSARPPVRSAGQARFTLQRGAAGWRVVDVSPRDLLTGVHGPA